MTESSTDVVPASSHLPAMSEDEFFEGLADFDESDLVVPTIKIDHPEGVFVNTLNNQIIETLDCAVLGLVKQRTMWDKEVRENEPPLCRSLDFNIGYPGKEFPWKESGFARPEDTEGCTIKCADCPFKEWGSHPTRERVPWCAEQHTYVIARPVVEDGDVISWSPALVTFQGAGITPSRKYLTSFMQSRKPTFTVLTRITLDKQKRGTVHYSVPKFQALEDMAPEREFFDQFVRQFRASKAYLQAPRGIEVEGEAEDKVPAPSSPGASSGAAAEAPREVPADDEMPF